jgi:hypothetical protein
MLFNRGVDSDANSNQLHGLPKLQFSHHSLFSAFSLAFSTLGQPPQLAGNRIAGSDHRSGVFRPRMPPFRLPAKQLR